MLLLKLNFVEIKIVQNKVLELRLIYLKEITLIYNKLNGTKGCSTPVGDAGRLRPRRNERDEEAQVSPHGKRASCSGIQGRMLDLKQIERE